MARACPRASDLLRDLLWLQAWRRASAGPRGARLGRLALIAMPPRPGPRCRRRPGPRCRPAGVALLPPARATMPAPAQNAPGTRHRARYCAGGACEGPRYRPARGERFWAISGPARGILRAGLPGAALAFQQAPGLAAATEIYFPPARSMPPAGGGRDLAGQHSLPCRPPRCRAGRARGNDAAPRALPAPQAMARHKFPPHSAAKHFCAEMFRRTTSSNSGGLYDPS